MLFLVKLQTNPQTKYKISKRKGTWRGLPFDCLAKASYMFVNLECCMGSWALYKKCCLYFCVFWLFFPCVCVYACNQSSSQNTRIHFRISRCSILDILLFFCVFGTSRVSSTLALDTGTNWLLYRVIRHVPPCLSRAFAFMRACVRCLRWYTKSGVESFI